MNPRELPIYEQLPELVGALKDNARLIITAPTGSGKSTQIPQILHDHLLAGSGKQIIVMQPRRLAARLLAKRVAQERQNPLGEDIGYQIRCDNTSSPTTKILYVTEGILLRRFLASPYLEDIGAIIFDEFHERHIYTDVTLALALRLQERARPDLKIIVMSATLETELVEEYLAPCAKFHAPGRAFPIHINYLPPAKNHPSQPWELAAAAVKNLDPKATGDILIFMPGSYEIKRTIRAIENLPNGSSFIVLPLHGELSPADQDTAVATYNKRKIVVATNVAETSITIDGIQLVIDSGLARVAKYDPHRGINTLLIEKISRASADQRSGRAGRTAPGTTFRLWPETENYQRPLHETPEIKRLDLADIILTLKAAGFHNLSEFPWLEPPTHHALNHALDLLTDLGALNHQGKLTPIGQQMLAFPVHPRYARMLIAAAQYGCVRDVALIAALSQGRPILLKNVDSSVRRRREEILGEEGISDFFILKRALLFSERHNVASCESLGINLAAANQIRPLQEYFLQIAREQSLPTEDTNTTDAAVAKCILAGFADHIARRFSRHSTRYLMTSERAAELGRESVVNWSPIVVGAEINEIGTGKGSVNVILSLATAIEETWLQEVFPEEMTERVVYGYSETTEAIVRVEQRLFRDLVLFERCHGDRRGLSKEEAAKILARGIAEGQIDFDYMDDAVMDFTNRVELAARLMPELGISSIDETAQALVLEQFCLGAYSLADLESRSYVRALKSWLTSEQMAALDRYLPTKIDLPGGKKGKIDYLISNAPPTLRVTIQNLFGLTKTPVIAKGRVKLRIDILAPNQRTVQTTQDLESFWQNHYPTIKKQLQAKYPKHKWL